MTDKKILLVEDNPSDVKLTQRALEKNNLLNKLVVAIDGQDALDYLFGGGKYSGRDVADQPSIILLDLKLPKIDGLTVLQRIRDDARTRLIPVIILTTSTEEMDLARAYELGANSYIRKPVDFKEFVGAVAQLGFYWLVLNEPPPTRG
jgi:two-component system response regulator